MDKKNSVYAGVFMILGALMMYGGNYYLDDNSNLNISIEDIDRVYVCTLTEELGTFHRVSDTKKTGYFYDENDEEQSDRCQVGRTYGTWELLSVYLENNGKTIDDLFKPKPNSGIIHYDCIPGSCTTRV